MRPSSSTLARNSTPRPGPERKSTSTSDDEVGGGGDVGERPPLVGAAHDQRALAAHLDERQRVAELPVGAGGHERRSGSGSGSGSGRRSRRSPASVLSYAGTSYRRLVGRGLVGRRSRRPAASRRPGSRPLESRTPGFGRTPEARTPGPRRPGSRTGRGVSSYAGGSYTGVGSQAGVSYAGDVVRRDVVRRAGSAAGSPPDRRPAS